jgi:site-specific recombinase XerC
VYLASLSSARGGSALSVATIAATLRALKAFFAWLADQPNYRGKARASDCQFLNPTANNARVASARRPSRAPDLEDIRRVIKAMPSGSDVEKRDRALIAVAIISGARLAALASLKLKHIDLSTRTIFQDAREVRTKARKTFTSCFMPVGDDIREIVESAAGRSIAVTENGKTLRIPAIEVMLRRLANDAMRSDPRAVKLLLSLVDRYGDSPETTLHLGELLAEDRDILAQYLPNSGGFVPDFGLKPDDGGHGDGS